MWGILAEKLAGRTSEQIFTNTVYSLLLNCLEDSDHPALQLASIVALEKFSLTGTNKQRIMEDDKFAKKLLQLEQIQPDCPIKKEIKFVAKWALDNTCECALCS